MWECKLSIMGVESGYKIKGGLTDPPSTYSMPVQWSQYLCE